MNVDDTTPLRHTQSVATAVAIMFACFASACGGSAATTPDRWDSPPPEQGMTPPERVADTPPSRDADESSEDAATDDGAPEETTDS